MRGIVTIIPLFVLSFLIGCADEEIVEDDLIGENWLATAGFQDEEAVGEPDCYPFEEGIKLIITKKIG